jgi:hypothetical protein
MALGDIPTREHSRRLDSWKEIAEYLRRDVRTATRWESQGLPLHRVPGGKGRSVYAFTDEIDAWMAGPLAKAVAESELTVPVGSDPTESAVEPRLPAPARNRFKYLVIGTACGLAVIAIGVTPILRGAARPIDLATAHATVTNLGVTISDESGRSRVVHRFDSAEQPMPPLGPQTLVHDLDADGIPEILAGISYYLVDPDRTVRGGELLNLAASGGIRWRFAFNDSLTFRDGAYSGPWVLTDWQVEPAAAPGRVAVAAHDYIWWASIVAMFDHTGRRLGTFVNPGWAESVLWLDRDRLAIAGFNNERNEGMLAVLDAADVDGQAPGTSGTAFTCPACPSSPPLFYATFARSELNQLTAERFNRARVSTIGNQIVVITSETARDRSDITAIYEFDRDLRFVRARYSDPYWDEHRRLELEGRLTHSRETCPERNGPPVIHVWDAAHGWTRTTPAGGG